MKVKIFILLFTGISICQSQITFPAPGAKWHYAKYTFAHPAVYNEQVTCSKDSVVHGKQCTLFTGLRYFCYCGGEGPSFVYTDNDKVYFYNMYTMNQWQLLYDFGTLPGQGWEYHLKEPNSGDIDTIKVSVDSVKTTFVNSIPLKTLFVIYSQVLDYGASGMITDLVSHRSVIRDRIGDEGYLLNAIQDFYGICDDGGLRLLCYEDSLLGLYQTDTLPCNYTNVGLPEFNEEDQLHIYPNPASNKVMVQEESGMPAEFTIYDVLGSPIATATGYLGTAALPNGIYFVQVRSSKGIVTRRLVLQH